MKLSLQFRCETCSNLNRVVLIWACDDPFFFVTVCVITQCNTDTNLQKLLNRKKDDVFNERIKPKCEKLQRKREEKKLEHPIGSYVLLSVSK